MSIIWATKNRDKSIGVICDTRIFRNTYNYIDWYDKLIEWKWFIVWVCWQLTWIEAIKDIKVSTDLFDNELRSEHAVRNFLYSIRNLLKERYDSWWEDEWWDRHFWIDMTICTHIDWEPRIFFSNWWAYVLDIKQDFHYSGFSADVLTGISMEKINEQEIFDIDHSKLFLEKVMEKGQEISIAYWPWKIFKALHLTI